MEKNIELNIKNTSGYDILRPQTTCEMVIDLLNSDTKTLMGLEQTDQADDAFRSLFYAITLDGRALINFTVMGNDSTPCTGIIIKSSQFCDSKGNLIQQVQTNNEGKVSVFVNSTSVNISISGYFDLQDYSTSYSVELGQIYDKSIILTRNNFLLMQSSTTKMFSNECKRVDVTCVGGGGGGNNVSYSGGGGGGGGYCTVQESITFLNGENYQAVVGAGGASGWGNNATSGGSTNFLGISANGGNCATENSNDDSVGGTGNGRGGNGARSSNSRGNNGEDGSVYGYFSFTELKLYGGGGGGGAMSYEGSASGTYNGGNGGESGGGGGGYASASNQGNGGKGVYGGGGGGGGTRKDDSGQGGGLSMHHGTGGSGGQGCVAIRMYTAQTLPNS